MSNKIDLVSVIETYGSQTKQDFKSFSSLEEQELLINKIKKCSKYFDFKGPEYIQILCDIVLIKTLEQLNDEEFDVTYYVDKLLEYMAFWDDVLTCRYLLKSGIDWSEKEWVKI